MYNSGHIVKNNFIQLSSKNTRVIDPNVLMAKRMEGFSGILRERSEEVVPENSDEFEDSDAIDVLTGDPELQGAPLEESLDIDDVSKECERMLAEANSKVEEMLAEAQNEAENLKSSAADKGYEDGYAKGREEALQELLQAKKELETEKESLRLSYDEKVRNIEPEMVSVITGVYEHVFGSNFYSRRDVMVCLINRALLHVDGDTGIVIYVSPLDYDMLIGLKSSLFEKVAFRDEPEIRQRDDFMRGQAKIETPYGLIDCSIDTELKELKRMLKVLSYEGQSEA